LVTLLRKTFSRVQFGLAPESSTTRESSVDKRSGANVVYYLL
jgi:hypothetical protein